MCNLAIAFVSILAMSLLFSCQKSLSPTIGGIAETATTTTDGYKSEYKYNVNIVYLVPSDRDTVANFKNRLSELFLWAQDWTKKEMARHGYPDQTFGLLVNDSSQVKIHVLRSQYKHSELPYDIEKGTGASRAEQEVNKYLNENSRRQSDHTIILYPGLVASDGYTAMAGTPFYGRGRICHALDYGAMSLANVSSSNGDIRREVRKWFGGMIHELFHGLNLPHNSETQQEYATKKIAVMRDHYNYGPAQGTESILTATDAAIFSVAQIFSKTEGQFYGRVNTTVELEQLSYDAATKSILLKGEFNTDNKIKKIVAYIDPKTEKDPPLSPNTNYNAVTFITDPINNTFSFSIPVDALKEFGTAITNHLYVGLVHENGTFISGQIFYPFTFNANKEPLFILNATLGSNILLDKTNWKIESFSSEHGGWNNYVRYTIDGDLKTAWYPSAETLPHQIVINLGADNNFNGFVWTNMQTGSFLRPAKEVEVLISNDPALGYTSLGTFTLVDTRLKQHILLKEEGIKAHYIKFIVKRTFEGNSYLYVSEIDLFSKMP
ncbi:MAG: hypothetical protein K0R59_126 [Sphingobacterium sp.]|nr:hypothetical protein [Sphingobacterium sp.]